MLEDDRFKKGYQSQCFKSSWKLILITWIPYLMRQEKCFPRVLSQSSNCWLMPRVIDFQWAWTTNFIAERREKGHFQWMLSILFCLSVSILASHLICSSSCATALTVSFLCSELKFIFHLFNCTQCLPSDVYTNRKMCGCFSTRAFLHQISACIADNICRCVEC